MSEFPTEGFDLPCSFWEKKNGENENFFESDIFREMCSSKSIKRENSSSELFSPLFILPGLLGKLAIFGTLTGPIFVGALDLRKGLGLSRRISSADNSSRILRFACSASMLAIEDLLS